jgi:Transposase and inactivated derivatives
VSAENDIPNPAEPAEVAELRRQLERANRALKLAQLKIQVLEERLRLQRIKKYGPASEKLNDAQLELLEFEPGVSNLEVQAESTREPLPHAAPTALKPRSRRHPGRQELPAHLPRVEKIVGCTPEQCTCKKCGEIMSVIGHDLSEQLDVEPPKYFVTVLKREKRACRGCEQGGVTAAPMPERIVEKGLAGNRVVIDTVISKYVDHLPLYRQSAMLEREAGVEISRATLDGWVMRVGELLGPVVGMMRRELLAGGYIQADETPVDVQMHDGRGQNHQAYLWQYGKPGGSVVFDFRLGRVREGPKEFLGNFEGLLQTDGYVAYEKVGGAKLVHAACWAHARRKFYEAHALDPAETAAKGVVELIDELFAMDAEARARNCDLKARDRLRQQKAPPLLEVIKQNVEAVKGRALPSSKLAGAAAYTLALWPKLTRFLEYPELELSNNLAENSMRPVALGRKNWIHIGSAQAGPKVAALLSVMESCRRLHVSAREYLADVLPGLAARSVHSLATLTPAAWAVR